MRKRVLDRSALVAALEAGLAAGVAWWLAATVLGVDRPLYAPVAAVVVVGAGFSRRIGRVGAMLGGMAIAVAISEVGVRLLGSGPYQLALLTALAIVVARAVTQQQLTVLYAGLNTAILVAIGGEGWVPDRVVEGIIGAAAAYVLVYLVLPPRPAWWVQRAMADQVGTACDHLAEASQALREACPGKGERSEWRSQEIDRNADHLDDTVDFSREVSRFSPWRWKRRHETEEMIERVSGLQSILRDTTVLVRMASRYAKRDEDPDDHIADALDAHREVLAAMLAMVTGDGEAADLRAANREAEQVALAPCAQEGPLHFALVEELVSIAGRVADWAEDFEQEAAPAQA